MNQQAVRRVSMQHEFSVAEESRCVINRLSFSETCALNYSPAGSGITSVSAAKDRQGRGLVYVIRLHMIMSGIPMHSVRKHEISAFKRNALFR